MGIIKLRNNYPGTFMVMSESRRKVAEKICKDGYSSLTSAVFKDYMDVFYFHGVMAFIRRWFFVKKLYNKS